MPEDTLTKIFNKFYETRSHGGVGIGPYIAKRFAQLLGGQIVVESTKGKGSTFRLTIPRAPKTATS
jgi:signal transduction histidine kinase